jgi:hypothetical protein
VIRILWATPGRLSDPSPSASEADGSASTIERNVASRTLLKQPRPLTRKFPDWIPRAGIAAAIVGVGIIFLLSLPGRNNRAEEATRVGSSVSAEHAKAFNDGIFVVNKDIAPGTYRAPGTEGCYFERLKGFGGNLDDVISNGNSDSSQVVVTIQPTDMGFKSENCGIWTRIAEPTHDQNLRGSQTDASVNAPKGIRNHPYTLEDCAYDYLSGQGKVVDSSGRGLTRAAIGKLVGDYAIVKSKVDDPKDLTADQFQDLCVGGANYAYEMIEGNDRVGGTITR